MTTSVEINAVDWPVQVTHKEPNSTTGLWEVTHREIIEPYGRRFVHIHSTHSVTVTELPKEVIQNEAPEHVNLPVAAAEHEDAADNDKDAA